MSIEDGNAALSRPIQVETIRLRGTDAVVETDAAERAAIAQMLGLASIESLKAVYELSRNGEKVKLQGTIEASLHQICVVTVEPFPVTLEVPVRLDYAPEMEPVETGRRAEADKKDKDKGKIDIEIALNEDDPPEPIVGGVIDLGGVTVEFLALALDPYPRKPGVSFEQSDAGPLVESPFAALARLKREP